MLDLQELEFAAVRAMEQIVAARDDVATIKALIGKNQNAEHNDTLIELSEQADSITTALNDLESLIRVPHETTGIVYDADKLMSHIGMAQFYVGSSRGAPTAAAKSYMEIAERETGKTIASVNDYLGSTLVEFRDRVSVAGIGLLSDVDSGEEL
jgi:hypothetical protein